MYLLIFGMYEIKEVKEFLFIDVILFFLNSEVVDFIFKYNEF